MLTRQLTRSQVDALTHVTTMAAHRVETALGPLIKHTAATKQLIHFRLIENVFVLELTHATVIDVDGVVHIVLPLLLHFRCSTYNILSIAFELNDATRLVDCLVVN